MSDSIDIDPFIFVVDSHLRFIIKNRYHLLRAEALDWRKKNGNLLKTLQLLILREGHMEILL